MSVVERAENIDVAVPQEEHSTIRPFSFLDNNPGASGLVILNQDLAQLPLPILWQRTEVRVCADGGANSLYDYWQNESERRTHVPQFIVGDLDSIRPEVAEYYKKLGTRIIPQYSQYDTDFTKSLQTVKVWFNDMNAFDSAINEDDGLGEILDPEWDATYTVYAVGGMGGRFDQSVHSVTQLIQHQNLVLVTPSDVIFSTFAGTNYISFGEKKQFSSKQVPVCGLLPLAGETVLNTYGLRYDVEEWPSGMMGNVSSNNGVSGRTGFVVKTTIPIVINIQYDLEI